MFTFAKLRQLKAFAKHNAELLELQQRGIAGVPHSIDKKESKVLVNNKKGSY